MEFKIDIEKLKELSEIENRCQLFLDGLAAFIMENSFYGIVEVCCEKEDVEDIFKKCISTIQNKGFKVVNTEHITMEDRYYISWIEDSDNMMIYSEDNLPIFEFY